MLESRVKAKYGDAQVQVNETEAFEGEARLAITLIERWGPNLWHEEGEDSAGRQKFRSQALEDLVTRAFETARIALRVARERNLIHVLPSLEELIAAEAKVKDPLAEIGR